MSEPTVEEVLSLSDESKPQKKSSVVSVILALFLIPPLGIAMVWKQREHHRLYALYTIVSGILNLLLGFSVYGFIRDLPVLYKGLGVGASEPNLIYQLILPVLFGLLQVALGYVSFKKAKSAGFLSTGWLVWLTALAAINILIGPVLAGSIFFSVLGTIYNNASSAYNVPY